MKFWWKLQSLKSKFPINKANSSLSLSLSLSHSLSLSLSLSLSISLYLSLSPFLSLSLSLSQAKKRKNYATAVWNKYAHRLYRYFNNDFYCDFCQVTPVSEEMSSKAEKIFKKFTSVPLCLMLEEYLEIYEERYDL